MTENTVVLDDDPALTNQPALDAMPVANATPPPCKKDDFRHECWVGKRGTPDEPCFHITAYLDGVARRDVFAAPDAKSRKLGVILGATENEASRPAAFEVRDSRDGWLLIDGAADDPDINDGIDRPMYHGKGWIRGEGVGVSAQAEEAFARPDFASDMVYKGDDWFDGLPTLAILGCDGSWVHGRWKLPKDSPNPRQIRPEAIVSRDPLVIEGWVTGVCEIMETTCDSLSGNRPKSE